MVLRRCLQGTFFRGTLGCVLREDLGLFLDACAKDLPPLSGGTYQGILSVLRRSESITTEQLRAELRVSRSQLRKALVELGIRHLVMESPKDTWLPINRASGSGAQLEATGQLQAQAEVIRRFITVYGPAAMREIADWSSWSTVRVRNAVNILLGSAKVAPCTIDGFPGPRYVCTDDIPRIQRARPIKPFVSILDCFDPLVRAQKTDLEQRFGYGSSIPAFWHYVLVNGEWLGALWTHYRVRLLWIRELFLDNEVIADEFLTREVFDQIRRLTPNPVRVDSLNGTPPHFPINRQILEEQGYRLENGKWLMADGSWGMANG